MGPAPHRGAGHPLNAASKRPFLDLGPPLLAPALSLGPPRISGCSCPTARSSGFRTLSSMPTGSLGCAFLAEEVDTTAAVEGDLFFEVVELKFA